MELTNDALARYVRGQLEIHNPSEHYLYRGEIERAWLDEKGDLRVLFKWCAKMEGDKWQADPVLDYHVSRELLSATINQDGRITYFVMLCGERGTFFLPDGSKLDPAKVEGLELEPA